MATYNAGLQPSTEPRLAVVRVKRKRDEASAQELIIDAGVSQGGKRARDALAGALDAALSLQPDASHAVPSQPGDQAPPAVPHPGGTRRLRRFHRVETVLPGALQDPRVAEQLVQRLAEAPTPAATAPAPGTAPPAASAPDQPSSSAAPPPQQPPVPAAPATGPLPSEAQAAPGVRYRQVRKRRRDGSGAAAGAPPEGGAGAPPPGGAGARELMERYFTVYDLECLPEESSAGAAPGPQGAAPPPSSKRPKQRALGGGAAAAGGSGGAVADEQEAYAQMMCNYMPMVREFLDSPSKQQQPEGAVPRPKRRSKPAAAAAPPPPQPQPPPGGACAPALETAAAGAAPPGVPPGDDEYVYDLYVCDTEQMSEWVGGGREQGEESWEARLAGVPIIQVEEDEAEWVVEGGDGADTDSEDSNGEQDYPEDESDDGDSDTGMDRQWGFMNGCHDSWSDGSDGDIYGHARQEYNDYAYSDEDFI